MNWIEDFKREILSEKPNIKKALELKSKFVPSRMFQYKSVSSKKIESLKDDTIWFTSPLRFNDPYDFHLFIDPLKLRQVAAFAVLQNVASESELASINCRLQQGAEYTDILLGVIDPDGRMSNIPGAEAEFRRNAQILLQKEVIGISAVYKRIKEKIGISCFSERNDSPLMWAHYASSHTGFCVEYDFAGSSISSLIYPVLYEDEIFECSCVFDEKTKEQVMIAALVKSKDWAYEKEWRVISTKEEPIDPGFSLSAPTPKAVYLGSFVDKAHKKEIVGICDDRGIEVFKMAHSPHAFQMVPEKCN